MVAADAQDRGLQVVEAPLGDPRGDLGAGAQEDGRLVDHDQAAGLLDGRLDGVEVDGRHGPQVEDLDRLALLLGRRGGLQAGLDHRTVGGQRQVGAGTGRTGGVQRGGHGGAVQLRLVVVAALGLEEDDRVIALYGLLEHPVGVGGVRRRYALEARDVREERLGGLAVVLDGADRAAVGNADDDGQLDLAERAGVHLGELGDDLVVRGEDEPVELDLHDGAVAAQREADRGADDAGLRERGVDDPVLAEVLVEAVGDAEDAAELADVLSHDQDLGVVLQRGAQGGVDRLGDRELLGGHVSCPPRRTTPGRRRTGRAPRRRARARRRRCARRSPCCRGWACSVRRRAPAWRGRRSRSPAR